MSGQNVLFVLAVTAPMIGRLRRRGRFSATLALLVLFASVTRFEPSVLRATAMAGIAAAATVAGRPSGSLRILALAVAGLVLVDPLLVLSLGFRLSVAASAGIVLWARPLARALPGPAPVRSALAVTASAQAAVAPLLVPAFGPLPVAALPANLLAEPGAGLVMMWGCTAGVVAGVLPSWAATVLHLPTRIGLSWVAGVARMASEAPLGRIGLGGVAAVFVLAALGAWARARSRGAAAAVAWAAAVLVLLAVPLLGRASPAPGRTDAGGAQLWRGRGPHPATVLVVPGNARADRVLAAVRDAELGTVDLVVLTSGGPMAAEVLRAVGERVDVREVWAPPTSPAGEAVAPPAASVEAGGLRVRASLVGERLEAEVAVVPAEEAADPR